MQGDQVGLCRRGRHRKRLSKHPSNSKGSEPVSPAVMVKGHAGSSPGLGETQTQGFLGVVLNSRINWIRLVALRLLLKV